MTKLIAFHGQQSIKDKYLARVKQHRQLDEIRQGFYWKEGKGCAVGCTIHGDDHYAYEQELGIPVRIAYLEDKIFEGMPTELAKAWPVRFLSCISVGADLNLVWNRFAYWLLVEFLTPYTTDNDRKAVQQVAELHQRTISGNEVTEKEWRRAAAAAYAAYAAAAYAAAYAAYADADAAAAKQQAFVTMSDKLIQLLEEAPLS